MTETAGARLSASISRTWCVSRIPGTMESLAINIFLHQPRWKPWLTLSEMKVSEKEKIMLEKKPEYFQTLNLFSSCVYLTPWC